MSSLVNRLMKIENAVKVSQQGDMSSLNLEDRTKFDELCQKKRRLSLGGETLPLQGFAEWRHLFHKMMQNTTVTKEDVHRTITRMMKRC